MILTRLAIILIVLTGNMNKKETQNPDDIYEFKIPNAGDIQPGGWIKEQLGRDLNEGYAGHYDDVHHTVTHNVFVEQDRLSRRKIGLRKEWWSGEHEGYWKDGVIRMAFLTGDQHYIQKAKEWVEEIILNTGEDGYIGIYKDCEKPNCRFNHVRENGELWTTSRIVMALLVYYEFTGDERVLAAAEKCVKLVMSEYNDKNYFLSATRGGGVSHGVGFFENLEWLYRITGNEQYLEFSEKLYQDFNSATFRDDDLQTAYLLDKDRLFRKHGAHVAEGLFVPGFVAAINKKEKYKVAADNVIYKLKQHLTPGGAMRSDEFINGRKGTADERYEYCGIAEMISPLNKLVSFTGNLELADLIESMTFNAGQGARFPVLTGLSYLTKDNRIRINHREFARRESYDAAHLAAACCALNGTRLMPYYVEGMWMVDENENAILANLYGPGKFHTELKGVDITINEQTNYPFSDEIKFSLKTEKPVDFKFILRRPYGCEKIEIKKPEKATIREENDRIIISNTWKNDDVLFVNFNFEIKKVPQPASKSVDEWGIYLKRGPLVYAFAFDHDIDTVKEYRNSGFYRYRIKTVEKNGWNLKIDPESEFKHYAEKKSTGFPWEEPVVFISGYLMNEKNKKQTVKLVPLGNTIFRRVTFSVWDN